jgi:alpha-glucosidase (family GH31 glycosyl hydrolase)
MCQEKTKNTGVHVSPHVSPDNIIAAYRAATGAAPLWPKWAYGFWQCRERYSSQ